MSQSEKTPVEKTPPRRRFLRNIGIGAAGVVLGRALLSHDAEDVASAQAQVQAPEQDQTPRTAPVSYAVPLMRRKFGRHDVELSALGIGGHTLASAASDAESNRIVDEALAAGVNFMDNCWDYHNGRAEEVMGRALKGKRDKAFLMTKVCTHGQGGKKEAMKMLEDSLRRLQTDHLDLWQLHAIATMDQVRHAFEPGSVLEALEEAKKQGKTRFIGFTGHTDPDVHLAMLKNKFAFDSCQLPLSAIEANSDAFVRRVLPELVRQNIAPLAMKTLLGNARPIRDGVMTVSEALRYALSLPVTTVVSGVKSVEHLRQNLQVVKDFKPMTPAEMTALEKRCLPATDANQYQSYRQWLSYRDGDSSRLV